MAIAGARLCSPLVAIGDATPAMTIAMTTGDDSRGHHHEEVGADAVQVCIGGWNEARALGCKALTSAVHTRRSLR